MKYSLNRDLQSDICRPVCNKNAIFHSLLQPCVTDVRLLNANTIGSGMPCDQTSI